MPKTTTSEVISAVSHLIGLGLAIAALVLMVIIGARFDNTAAVVGLSVFGSSLILLYAASGIYHLLPSEHKAKEIFYRLDHAMIYVLIAGTYTPICLTMPSAGWGWSLFGVIWGLAILGVIIKTVGIKLPTWISTLLYILMGWLILIAIAPLSRWFNSSAWFWLFGGGVMYTCGCIFFLLEHRLPKPRWFGMHEIFHLFVIAGSFSHFWLMFSFVARF